MPVMPQKINPKLNRKRRFRRMKSNLWVSIAVLMAGMVLFFQNCARDRFQTGLVEKPKVTYSDDVYAQTQEIIDSAKQKTVVVTGVNGEDTADLTQTVLKAAEQTEIDALKESNACDLRTKPLAIEYAKCPHTNDYQNRRDYKVFCGANGVWTRVLVGTDISSCMAPYCDPSTKPAEREKVSCPAPTKHLKWATQSYLLNCVGSTWSRTKSTYDGGKCPLTKPKLKYTLNLAYPRANGEQQGFDLYYPSDYQVRKYPIFVWIHGGNWRAGDKSKDSYIAKAVAELGYIVFNINYTLVRPAMSSTNFPAGPDDINAFFLYLNKNLSSVNADKNTAITIGGSAAGAHLAMSQAVRTPAPVNFKCVVDISGPVDLTPESNYWVLSTIEGTFNYFFNGDHRQLASLTQRSEGSPLARINSFTAKDILIAHAYNDNIVPFDQVSRLQTALKKKGGVRVQTTFWNDGTQPVFEMSQASHNINEQQMVSTLRNYLSNSRCR